MPKLLKVLANPYVADLDHLGRCHGHVQYEPDPVNGDASLRWVGCRLVATMARENKKSLVPGWGDDYDHVWFYSAEPATVPDTAYYLMQIRHGALIPADRASHMAAFGGPDGFIEPMRKLAQFAKERGACPEPVDTWKTLLASSETPVAAEENR